jgi:ubiquinone/menaquinone biosynthesis C-methylase UbiE
MSAPTTPRPTPEQVRDRVHQMWGSVAGAWAEHADEVEHRAEVVSRVMIEAVAPQPGDTVLELACGAGGLGLAIADRIGPGGSVLLSDVAPEMVEIAAAASARRAEDAGGPDVSTRVIDLEQIDLPEASFDIVVCREGLMFALDPRRAAGEIARVLRPGGRLAVAVWGPRDRNPWLGVLADAIQEHTGSPVPPPGVPGPFSLSADGQLHDALAGAGLEQVHVEEVAVPTDDASFEQYWQVRLQLAGPLKNILAGLPNEVLGAIRATVREQLRKYATPDGLTIPGLAYVATASRPAAPTGSLR